MTDGREETFRRLYAAHFDAVLGFALRRTDRPEDAADVTADTFLVAWRRLAHVPAGQEQRPRLYGVARRVLANHRRGDRRRTHLGERLRRVRPYLEDDECFLANYGDVLTDAPMNDLIDEFERTDAVTQFLAVKPGESFHVVGMDESGRVSGLVPANELPFRINGGYFVLRQGIFDYLDEGDDLVMDGCVKAAAHGRTRAVAYDGFWAPMDTLKERTYLEDLGRLPDTSLVSMVPVGLKSRRAESLAGGGGNAVGSVMVQLGTHLADPADRLASVHRSMKSGKDALASMTPNQIVAMSALGMAPSIVIPMLRLNGLVRPPFNLIISNVPGPRATQYLNGARMTGTYPVSVPMQGMALNITCNSYADEMCFGLTGCRRSVPHLQRLLTYLDAELDLLENAVGVA